MKKIIIIAVLCVLVVFFAVLSGKFFNIVQSDKYNFSKKSFPSKLKYLVKSGYDIIDINIRQLGKDKHPQIKQLQDKRVLLLGASISKYWYIHEYFKNFHSLSVYKFDKTMELREYLTVKGVIKKPNAVILKECAAFIDADTEKFNRDFDDYKKIYKSMVKMVKENDIKPIVATVCPVVYKGPHLDNILAFNDWLKKYAENNELLILDIEKAVRVSESDRRLRKEISQKDGLHLKREAYEKYLNPLVITLLDGLCLDR